MLISQIILDLFWQGLLHMEGNLVGHISTLKFRQLEYHIIIVVYILVEFCRKKNLPIMI
jgi:hypothetical protein